ncbi:adaptin ear-binding coat-associated protein 1 NECAP-1 [Gaertneriomyces semiglobifer]|nr:adaptin ear-binding coat-associated protein 1 NECAP-1 [Gaertneriomyces semiglobifer]
MADFESVLLLIPECFVYRIPSRATSRGYRASDWDVNQHLWTGRLRIVSKGDNAFIRLEDPNTGDLFAVSPYDPQSNSVEPVLDSSRYFVLRVVDATSGQHAFIGMGFPERSAAFDFNVALQDWSGRSTRAQPKPDARPEPKLDYSLKEGQTISIKIGGSRNANSKPTDSLIFTQSNAVTGGALRTTGSMLPPPPSGRQGANKESTLVNDDWAEFTGLTSIDTTATKTKSNQGVPPGWTTF